MVLDRIISSLDAAFHEPEQSKSMKAKRDFDAIENGKDLFLTLQAGWQEWLVALQESGIHKSARDLYLE